MIEKLKLAVCFAAVGLMASAAAHGDVIFQMQLDEVFVNNNDPSVTSFSNDFDSGAFNGAERYFYGMSGASVADPFDESVSFESTTHTFDLDNVTWDFLQFSGSAVTDSVAVELFVNEVSVGTQSTPTGADTFDAGTLTWDLSSIAPGANYALRFNIAEAGDGDVTFFELENITADGAGLTVNGTITAIPEPTSLGFLGLVGLGLFTRRRR